ncbi:MAG: LPS export ABC transporter periplasmic protein LptC [Fodinibius sp.]|nr:LPS export ABC transporter periplasmic protein LptC [Fodinibius sp.]
MEQHNTLFVLVFSLLIVTGISSCGELSEKQAQQVDQALKDSLTSTTETWNVDMEIIEEGQKKVRLWGSYAASYTNANKKSETRIRGPVKIHVFDSTGTVTTRVFSDRAVYQSENAIFELYGDVRVNTADNRHLESEYLKWQQDANKISTSKFVIITTPTDSLAGTGFEGKTDLTNYTIKDPRGRVIVD